MSNKYICFGLYKEDLWIEIVLLIMHIIPVSYTHLLGRRTLAFWKGKTSHQPDFVGAIAAGKTNYKERKRNAGYFGSESSFEQKKIFNEKGIGGNLSCKRYRKANNS